MDPAATGLWPDGVAFCEAATSGVAPALWPEEAAHVIRAAPGRAAEFAWGRDCARAALRDLGVAPCAIPVAENRSPVWPAGVHGTISHTDGYAAAAAASDGHFVGIGVDAEPATRLERRLWPKITTATEQHWLQGLDSGLDARAATLLFCAKEAFYKCQYPATRRWLGFADVEVELSEVGTRGSFAVRVLGARARGDRTDRAVGRYLVRDDGLLLASAWIARSGTAGPGTA